MLEAKVRPIEIWPGQPTKPWERRESRFRAPWRDTVDLLDRELFILEATDVVVQMAISLADIRNDGWIRADARPNHPGVILSFRGTVGWISLPCDTFKDWQSNLRAIALSLEALRLVDRYGVTRNNEQYKGWTALPPADGADIDARMAANLLSAWTGEKVERILAAGQVFAACYRAAARKLHPDAGGSHEQFVQLQQVKEILLKVHPDAF